MRSQINSKHLIIVSICCYMMSALLIKLMLRIYGTSLSAFVCKIKNINVLNKSTPWIAGVPFKGIACLST